MIVSDNLLQNILCYYLFLSFLRLSIISINRTSYVFIYFQTFQNFKQFRNINKCVPRDGTWKVVVVVVVVVVAAAAAEILHQEITAEGRIFICKDELLI